MTTSWPRISLFYCIGVMAAGQMGIVPPLLPALQHDLDISLATAGAMVSIITSTGAVFGLFAGGWSERMGHGRALLVGTLIMAVSAAFCAVSANAEMLLALRGLSGVGYLLVVIASPSLIAAAAEPRHRPLALSIWGTFVPVGIALFELPAATLADSNWRIVFAADAALVMAILLVAMVAAPLERSVRHADRNTLLPALRSSMPLAAAFFCFALLFLALAGILPAYLVQRRGLQAASAGRIVAIATACGVAGSLFAGWAMRRGAVPGRLVAVGLLTSAALAALMLERAVPLALVGEGLAASFALGGLVPAAVFAAVPSIAPDASAIGPINGLLAQAGSLGSLAGPPLIALCVEWGGWWLGSVILLAVAAVGASCAMGIARPN